MRCRRWLRRPGSVPNTLDAPPFDMLAGARIQCVLQRASLKPSTAFDKAPTIDLIGLPSAGVFTEPPIPMLLRGAVTSLSTNPILFDLMSGSLPSSYLPCLLWRKAARWSWSSLVRRGNDFRFRCCPSAASNDKSIIDGLARAQRRAEYCLLECLT
jgi:hypothetical protein